MPFRSQNPSEQRHQAKAGTLRASRRFCHEHFMKVRGSVVTAQSKDGDEINPAPNSNTDKEPEDWVSVGDPMTGAQASSLKTLSEECDAANSFELALERPKLQNGLMR
jgi:hypothetical protein